MIVKWLSTKRNSQNTNMKLQQLLTQDCTECAVPATSKKKILEHIAAIAATKYPEISQQELLDSLIAREKMGSTGIGNGMAIPHGRLTQQATPIAIVLTSEQPIAFDAIDNRDVDVFVALFVPEDECKQHLSTLQSIAAMFSDNQFLKAVRHAESSKALFELVTQAH